MSLRQTRPRPADQPRTQAGGQAGQDLDVVVAGAHGGAGTSTLAALLPAVWDMGSIGPLLEVGRSPLRAKGRPVVLAVRNTAVAAKDATAAIGALAAWEERVAALAIVSDGGPEPREATARFALLEGRVGGVVRVPHVRALRLVEDPCVVALPGKARLALAELRRLVGGRAGQC
ncbi:hypothetical protein [Actinomadura sp. BRA 177]|uniref:hypothetical protein n=1 Tax=Actinomadura sp. BRA 177 TaxID=2745202 RepID=UPI00159525B9|nr:hypothetical protein [Actinomadura sp. BRA 177]NVI86818.1 hypothetical protein [Actinomadura sp. BRA 177]